MDARLRQILTAGPATAEALRTRLAVSQPSVSRLLARHADEVLVLGRARAARYALRRPIRDLPAELPLYRIDEGGAAQEIGRLYSIWGGYWFDDLVRPRNSALFAGLPWFLADMRPQGFLGRDYSRRHPELNLPERPGNWQDDHALYALARRGEDASGNLLIGEESFTRWATIPAAPALALRARTRRYPGLAEQALAGELAGSSAGGEQPKFTVTVAESDGPAQMLVKFSEPLDTPTGRRWGDLLLAEHHALAVIEAAGLPAAHSRLLEAGGRLFLELRRFDRVGGRGRRGLISLGAVDDEFIGQRRHWLDSAQALQRQRLLGAQDVERIAWLQAFGGFIGNTDMHHGNCSLLYDGAIPLQLAPAYDMLPMIYAPQRGELRTPAFQPAAPPPRGLAAARQARMAALQLWDLVAQDTRVSAGFRKLARANAALVAALQW